MALETLKIVNDEGNDVEIKVITTLEKKEDGKKFLLYTFDETPDNVDIYASIIKEGENDEYILDSIEDKEDWQLIQKAMAELSETGDSNE